MLLETVIATGLLIMGLAVIGTQVQGAQASIRKMELRLRAMMLVEKTLAELDLGLVELDTVDEVQEEEYGPRYPNFGWRLTTERIAVDGMYLLTFDVLYRPQTEEEYGDYREGQFDHDEAEVLFTSYALRAAPQPLNLADEFGLEEEEFLELSEKLADFGIEGLDAESFDTALLARVDTEELLKILPLIADVFGIDLNNFLGLLPPDLLKSLEEAGLMGDDGDDGADGEDSGQ